ncbi:MAG: hypothetical protein IAF00_03405 [Phycisphaerales bacterium]|nr:hypothetical protein [Phycisphaerales bacterium]
MNTLARRRWLNLVLLVLLGLVGGLAMLVWLKPKQERHEDLSGWLDLTPAQIEQIEVERPGQVKLVFTRQEDRWWMSAPEHGLANPILLNPILHLAETHCALQYAVAELDLKSLQLDPPQLRLKLNDQEIRFGTTTPTDGQRYLQIAQTVHLCPDRLYPLLTSAEASFRAPPIDTSALSGTKNK